MANDQKSAEQLIKSIDQLSVSVFKTFKPDQKLPVFGVPAKNALAYVMITTHIGLAMEAAKRGDWNGAAKHLVDMSNSAVIVASGGNLGLLEYLYDCIAAARTLDGHDMPQFNDWLNATVKSSGDIVGNSAWGLAHPEFWHSPPAGDYHFPDPADAGVPGGAPDAGNPADQPIGETGVAPDNRPTDYEVDDNGNWIDTQTGETGPPSYNPSEAGLSLQDGGSPTEPHEAGVSYDPSHDGASLGPADGASQTGHQDGANATPEAHQNANPDPGPVPHADFNQPAH
jgi:hypothetical protein